MRTDDIRVEALRGLAGAQPWLDEIARLNLQSRRPSPFATPEFLAAYLAHDEQALAGSQPLLLLAFRGAAPVGFLALCRRPERVLGRRCTRLEFLTRHDADRPAVAARPEDEAACASAMLRHLATREPGWDLLELAEQDEASALGPALAELPGRFYTRRYPNNPNGTIELASAGFEAWFHELSGDQRSKISRRARALLGAGDVELVVCADRAAAGAMLDLYLDVEARSWKVAARAGVSRHPERVAFFRALLEPGQPAAPVFLFLVKAGLPIAGFLTLAFQGVVYGMEMAFDAAEAEAAPGNVLMLLAIRDAATRGAHAFNMLGNFEYHKARWRAAVTETSALQVYRRGYPHHLKALAGEWRRRLFGTATSQRDVEFNLTRQGLALEPPPIDREASRRSAEAALAGPAVQRLGGAALAALLPFAVPGLGPPAVVAPPPRRRGQRNRTPEPASGS